MAEVAPAGGGGINRSFLLIVGGLAALLVIGLLAIGALVLSGMFNQKPPVASVTLTPTRVAIATATAVPTATPVTPEATATLVVAANATTPATAVAGGSTPEATATTASSGASAEATATPEPSGTLPQGGLGDNLALLGAGGLVLVAVLFAARRARAAG